MCPARSRLTLHPAENPAPRPRRHSIMKPIRILLATVVATATLLAQGLFPSSAAAPVDAPSTAMCDCAVAPPGSDAHIATD